MDHLAKGTAHMSVKEMLAGGNAFEFTTPGQTVEGTVVKAESQQQTDMNTKQPVTWPDGRPKMLIAAVIQTTLREGPDDHGRRNIYFSGHKFTALQQSGADDLLEGDWIRVTFLDFSDRDPQVKGHNRAKLYKVEWRKGARGGGVSQTINPGATAAPQTNTSGQGGPAYGSKPDYLPQNVWDTMPDAAKAHMSPPQAAPALVRPDHIPEVAWQYMPDDAKAAAVAATPKATHGPKPDYMPQEAWDAMADEVKAQMSPPPGF